MAGGNRQLKDSRSYDSTESSSFDNDVPVHAPTHGSDFRSYMFTFTIAIRPNHEHVRPSCLVLEVGRDLLQVLSPEVSLPSVRLWKLDSLGRRK
jgi:hypothetical protein